MLSKKIKRRNHRKHVRAEKQKLRAQSKKHKPRKWVYMTITGLEYTKILQLRAYAKTNHISVSTAVSRLITRYLKEQENGVQKEHNTDLEESRV